MSILGFSPEFRDQVEDGRKCRTYRMPKCIYERKTGRCTHIGIGSICSHDYLNCPGYEYRIKTGDTIHAYTGLMQRLYCKVNWCMDGQQGNDGRCQLNDVCSFQGAKLLRPDLPRCTDAYPIKLKYITEEDARLDGFKQKKDTCPSCGECNYDEVTTGDARKWDKKQCDECTPLNKLNRFFIHTYNAKPDTPIQAIIWEELKGDKAGK